MKTDLSQTCATNLNGQRQLSSKFTVKIFDQVYQGLNVDESSFSIQTLDHYIHFIQKQRIKSVLLTWFDGRSYTLDTIELASSKQNKVGGVWYFKVVLAASTAIESHKEFVDINKSMLNQTTSIHRPKTEVGQCEKVIERLYAAINTHSLSDGEFRELAERLVRGVVNGNSLSFFTSDKKSEYS
ncbi:MAG: hypothetical protein U9N57_01400 [Pseudomonadota bacterium]|nr:hypothetical protein [Pseudomonadota bacterium]